MAGSCHLAALSSTSCSKVRWAAPGNAFISRNASRMAFHMANILVGSSVSTSRPMPVRTKNKHSSYTKRQLRLIKELWPLQWRVPWHACDIIYSTSWRDCDDGCLSVAQQLSANKESRIKSGDGLVELVFILELKLRRFSYNVIVDWHSISFDVILTKNHFQMIQSFYLPVNTFRSRN